MLPSRPVPADRRMGAGGLSWQRKQCAKAVRREPWCARESQVPAMRAPGGWAVCLWTTWRWGAWEWARLFRLHFSLTLCSRSPPMGRLPGSLGLLKAFLGAWGMPRLPSGSWPVSSSGRGRVLVTATCTALGRSRRLLNGCMNACALTLDAEAAAPPSQPLLPALDQGFHPVKVEELSLSLSALSGAHPAFRGRETAFTPVASARR